MDPLELSPVEEMVRWFLRNYENAAESTPYDSAEGGYQYIWGDPVDTEETLAEQYEHVYSEQQIAEATRILERDYDVDDWVPVPPNEEEMTDEEAEEIEEQEDPRGHYEK